MFTTDLIIALVLLAFALPLTLFLLWVVINPLMKTFHGKKESGKLTKAAERLAKVDALIQDNQAKAAIAELRRAVFLDVVGSSELVRAVKEHHQNMLSRCLVLAEELGSRAESVADVEHLLMERCELLLLSNKANEAYDRLRMRREQAGKEVPAWSKTDYDRRAKDIKQELKRNMEALQPLLKKLFDALETPAEENIVYH